jgi:diguanylate cyclase (GGDEF)-like protein
VLWDLILRPSLLPDYQTGSAKLALCVLVFALCAVLGALGQLVIQRPVAALRPLIAAIALGLTGTLIVAVTTDQQLTTATGMMFVGSYTAISLFSLDPTASQLLTPAPAVRPDTLSLGRLVFLGLAVAVVPVIVGARQITGGNQDGLVLVISSATITTLVMVRIGQLSTQRDRAEQALRHDAAHDVLTGLPNRKEFVTQLGDALGRSGRSSILFCDLDRFKAVNDGFGHDHGDEVLIEVAQRLRQCVRADDLVSRFGGDEFVILFRNTTPDVVQTINRRIIDALSRPVVLSGASITIGVSTGTAHANNDTDPDELISRADHAMYTAKNSDA